MTAFFWAIPLVLATAPAEPPQAGLDIYFIDMNGGAATLIVTPAGETVLVDCGAPVQRDADRILHVLREVVKRPRIDHLITTHWHLDHYGALGLLEGKLEFGSFYDKGIPDSLAEDPQNFPKLIAVYQRVSKGRSHTLKPGDTIPLKRSGTEATLTVLMANGRKAANAEGPANPLCSEQKPKQDDPSDNGRSIALLLRFGEFEFFNPADLTWNVEHDLVCPENIVGRVELMQVSHHGLSVSSNPVMVHAVAPQVAIMANGPTKGGDKEVVETFKRSPGLADIWQLHRNWKLAEEENLPRNRTANPEHREGGRYIHVRVAADGGSFEVRIGEDGPAKKYTCRPAAEGHQGGRQGGDR